MAAVTEHRQRLASVGERIIDTFPKDDPVEQSKLIGAITIGQFIADFLQSEIADDGTCVDTGSDGESYDCHVTVKGREFSINVSPGHTEQEMDDWEAQLKREASAWDLLCPRVIEALKGVDPALASEFEAYVTTPGALDGPLPSGRV